MGWNGCSNDANDAQRSLHGMDAQMMQMMPLGCMEGMSPEMMQMMKPWVGWMLK